MKYLKCLAAVVILALVSQPVCFAGNDNNLSSLVDSGKTIKVFLQNFTNESGQTQISADLFKKAVETALSNRKAVKFEIVQSPEASDVQISGAIKNYSYSKTDPINSYGATATLVLDAVTNENYAEMTVAFTVTDTKRGNVLWSKEIKGYIEHTMTPEQSLPLVYDKVSRDFLWRSFGKPSKN